MSHQTKNYFEKHSCKSNLRNNTDRWRDWSRERWHEKTCRLLSSLSIVLSGSASVINKLAFWTTCTVFISDPGITCTHNEITYYALWGGKYLDAIMLKYAVPHTSRFVCICVSVEGVWAGRRERWVCCSMTEKHILTLHIKITTSKWALVSRRHL